MKVKYAKLLEKNGWEHSYTDNGNILLSFRTPLGIKYKMEVAFNSLVISICYAADSFDPMDYADRFIKSYPEHAGGRNILIDDGRAIKDSLEKLAFDMEECA